MAAIPYDIAVVGAGAAGLTAAIFASQTEPEAQIVVLDGAPRIGAKILISGGGRCNVTHRAVGAADFNGNRNAIAKVLRTFTVPQTVAWFEEMGVALKQEETGKLFPVTDRARTVVDALLRAAAGTEIRTSHRVISIEAGSDGFTIHSEKGKVVARRVILSTGGRSVPKTGSDGHGYQIARALGHSVTRLFPALVPLLVEKGHWMTGLSGTSLEAELTVRTAEGRSVARARGSMLFTHFGISGPVALDISRHWISARSGAEGVELSANFLPGESFESIEGLLVRESRRNPRATLPSVLRGRLPERLLDAVLEAPVPIAATARETRRALIRALVENRLPVTGDRGFDYAEVTAGGIPLSEIVVSTMKSRVCENLWLCGEILDVDGRIGGFNFQWAWASGRLAGIHAARSLHT